MEEREHKNDSAKSVFDFDRWKPKEPVTGLGDVVAAVIHAVTGREPCAGCIRRKKWLNKKFPFRAKNGNNAEVQT